MTQQITDTKTTALVELYSRVTRVAGAMGGTASPYTSSLSVQSAMAPPSPLGPRAEDAPALLVNMPKGFEVDFAPSNPLSIGTALSVTATRTVGAGRKSDRSFIFGPDGCWHMTQDHPLTDDEIRVCLTLEGPPVA
jgi:hypothetical protein